MATAVSLSQQSSCIEPPSRPASSLSGQISHAFQSYQVNGVITDEPHLRAALSELISLPISRSTARQFFRQADSNGDDYIDFTEFRNLGRVLAQWRDLYMQFDSNGDGVLSLEEYWRALCMFGYELDTAFVERYANQHSELREVSDEGGETREERVLGFDGFVQSCIKLDRLRKVHQQYVSSMGVSPNVVPFEHLVGMVHGII
ncbi:uncharacterized protein SAPINGB_P006341 [Magnusiomyces paraingens]|uniref:EF-hand domain-containing protein n=1 Tax=Magnusiomyces paraingens TaxID=2606893 RepID=A0A5E8C5L7_9ASCO|nr:uncharacterized protein SAPINGB_P006341 [Saprochaete ingens]VVT58702.1 unnamed protein product [Saprochaete ingens]